MKFKLYIFLFVLVLFGGGVMFHNKYKHLGMADPVFDKSLNIYFSVQNMFGVSSVGIWDHNLEYWRRVSWDVSKTIDLLIDPVSNQDVYCLFRRGDDEYIKKISSLKRNNQNVRSFFDIAVCMSDVLPNNKLLISYAPWVDTHTFFVGRTLGIWKLASLDPETGKSEDLLEKNSIINSPRYIRGTEDVLFRYIDPFEDESREFKIYNLKTKEERYLPIEVHVDRWCYDDKANRIYFQGAGFIWEYDMASERLKKLFEFKEKIDFLVKHPVEMKFLVKFSNNSKTMFYVDERGVVSEFFSI